jgi:hypothetical protein
MGSFRMLVLIVWLSLLAGCQGFPMLSDGSADWAIESVTLIEGEGEVRRDHRVVVKGDRIVWVGPMSAGGPPAAETIDGRNQFLIPGLWDAHIHYLYEEELTEAMPDLFLDHGITSVRDTGGDLERLVALRSGWTTAGRAMPRFYLSGPLLDGRLVVYDGKAAAQPALGTSIPDIVAAKMAVAHLKDRGADFIKIYELVSPEVFEALVEAARAEGMPIASHVPLSLPADIAGPQVDSMEHLRNIDLACARNWRAMLEARRARLTDFDGLRGYPLRRELHEAQRYQSIADYDPARCADVLGTLGETMQVPTLRLNAFYHSRPFEDEAFEHALLGLPESVRARWRYDVEALREPGREWDLRFANWSLGLVGDMHAVDIPIAAGTDTPIRLAIPGESLHRELELLVESGLSPQDAIFAATIAPARFFGLDAQMGRILEGQRADLVLLRADPLETIRNTREIQGVVAAGEWVRREAP